MVAVLLEIGPHDHWDDERWILAPQKSVDAANLPAPLETRQLPQY